MQNPCIQSGLASNRLVLCTASDEVPNSISNHTLQAMLTQAVVKRYRQAIDEVAEEARRRLGPVGAAARTSCEEAGAARC